MACTGVGKLGGNGGRPCRWVRSKVRALRYEGPKSGSDGVFRRAQAASARGRQRAADLAVEVVSPAPRDQRRDREEKMEEYARFGIRFYWLVDPSRRTIEVHELAGDVYEGRLQASSGTITAVPGCPGLRLDLDAMWAKVDGLNH